MESQKRLFPSDEDNEDQGKSKIRHASTQYQHTYLIEENSRTLASSGTQSHENPFSHLSSTLIRIIE